MKVRVYVERNDTFLKLGCLFLSSGYESYVGEMLNVSKEEGFLEMKYTDSAPPAIIRN